MANESTYAGIAGLVANVYDLALMVAQEGNAIAPLSPISVRLDQHRVCSEHTAEALLPQLMKRPT